MTRLILKVEAFAQGVGESVSADELRQAHMEANDLANRLGVWVECEIKGVTILCEGIKKDAVR